MTNETLTSVHRMMRVFVAPQFGTVTQDEALADSERRSSWNTNVDLILSWLSDPSSLREEEIECPTREATNAALVLAGGLMEIKALAPSHVLPTGDGGIVFEWRAGHILTMIEVDTTGTAEIIYFHGDQIIGRAPFSSPRATRSPSNS